MRKVIVNSTVLFVLGIISGALSKIFDIYTVYLGTVFSEITVWLLFGVLISIYSTTKKKAMLNVFLFLIGMLIAYYIVAELTNSVYGSDFIIFWFVIALISPVLAYFCWMAKRKDAIGIIIGVGIMVISILSSILVQEIEVHDIIINGILAYHLFIRKRNKRRDLEKSNEISKT